MALDSFFFFTLLFPPLLPGVRRVDSVCPVVHSLMCPRIAWNTVGTLWMRGWMRSVWETSSEMTYQKHQKEWFQVCQEHVSSSLLHLDVGPAPYPLPQAQPRPAWGVTLREPFIIAGRGPYPPQVTRRKKWEPLSSASVYQAFGTQIPRSACSLVICVHLCTCVHTSPIHKTLLSPGIF